MSSRKRSKPSMGETSQRVLEEQSLNSEQRLPPSQNAVLETGVGALLPEELRNSTDREVDLWIAEELEKFEMALGYSDAGNDPVRRMLAMVNLRMAIDPRICEKQIRARSNAILNTAKTLGLDRDLVRANTDERHVESVLMRIRDAAEKGVKAAGRKFQTRDGESPSSMPGRSTVLDGSAPEGGERTIPVGPLRTSFPDTSENTGHNRFRQAGGTTIEIDCSQEPETQD